MGSVLYRKQLGSNFNVERTSILELVKEVYDFLREETIVNLRSSEGLTASNRSVLEVIN